MRCRLNVLRGLAFVVLAAGLLMTGAGSTSGCGSGANNGGGGGGGTTGGGGGGGGAGTGVVEVIPVCGDGNLQGSEECDDGNLADGDGCSAACVLVSPSCGDGFVNDPNEACDDGNAAANDGCENDCRPTGTAQVATSLTHTCALSKAGTVRCWGLNTVGQLGYGHKINLGVNPGETPAAVAKSGLGGDVDVGGKVVQLALGTNHTCALLDTGNVRCWGTGALGYGNGDAIGDDESPASAGDVPVGGKVVQITAGDTHTCALLQTGAVRCWGEGRFGRLGYSDNIISISQVGDLGNTPDTVPQVVGDADVGNHIVQVSAGGATTCVLYDTAQVRCWGLGEAGRLGYADTFKNVLPFLDLNENLGDATNEMTNFTGFVPVGFLVEQISVGSSHTCVKTFSSGGNATVRCWGEGTEGRLGNNDTETISDEAGETPASVAADAFLGPVVELRNGGGHACLLTLDGDVLCWGRGADGQLGYGNPSDVGDDEFPNEAGNVPLGGKAVQVAAGGAHSCAVLEDGSLRCWGSNLFGELGYGNDDFNVGNTPATTPSNFGPVNVAGFV
ncbi:MAG TPA: DUF4215 domain-containing protein, partial [bacterium]|nr:DUF4215 domain-containing protein [bacterium]